MKVVLFCGGLGMRLREYSEKIPKPMVQIGYRPIIWHLMKYYAYHGHKDFILCLGYRGDVFKKYFLEYNECDSNDFTLRQGGKKIELRNNDISDWTITFVDTGTNSNIGQRLKAVEKLLGGEDIFFANYSDGLTDMDISQQFRHFKHSEAIASFVSVKPNLSYHAVAVGGENIVTDMKPFTQCDIRINGGYFIFRHEIFNYIKNGEELVVEPFHRLITEKKLIAYEYDGFWGCLDTFKDKQLLDDLHDTGNAPWEMWKNKRTGK
jgi:glucose-1-phosphate cytidylyltransferase